MKKRKESRVAMSVAEAIATAEAWNERASVLSTMAFELTCAFGVQYQGDEPAYLIKRLAGGATPVNPAHLEEIRLELFAAAEEARNQARVILTSAAEARPADRAPGLTGENVRLPVDRASIEIPNGGDEVIANPRRSAPCRELGDGPPSLENEEQGGTPAKAPRAKRERS